MGLDTIDIEEFATQVKTDIVSFFTNLIYANALGSLPWLNIPVIRDIIKAIIESIVTFLATTGGLTAFIINTKVFTTDQAKDYVSTVSDLLALPEDVSDEEWDRAERKANHAFAQLINYRK